MPLRDVITPRPRVLFVGINPSLRSSAVGHHFAVLLEPRNSVSVLYVNGAPAGFFELLKVDDDVVELSHFGLFEHALGLGLGKWFLLQALYAAWSSNPKVVRVSTNDLDHPRALQLYQRFGFSPVSTHDTTLLPLSEAELAGLSGRF